MSLAIDSVRGIKPNMMKGEAETETDFTELSFE